MSAVRLLTRHLLVAVGSCLVASAVVIPPTAAASPATATNAPGGRVVVILKNQLAASTPSLNQQNSVLAALPDTKPNHVAHFSVGNSAVAAVTSPDTTDQFLVGTDPHAAAAKYVTVPAQGSVTIGIVITPTASLGTVVRGTLNLVTPVSVAADLSFLLGGIVTTSGDVVASLPYGYVVGSD